MNLFSDLNIAGCLCEALAERGITDPTPVQKKIIPLITGGENTAFRSETGTGKTFAYLLPAITKYLDEKDHTRILIIAPTHELAAQIKNEASFLLNHCPHKQKAALFIGGAPLKRQCDVLKQKPLVTVGSPVRLLELIRIKKLKVKEISFVVFDELDRLLKPEVKNDLENIIKELPPTIRYAACSATIDKKKVDDWKKILPQNFSGEIRFEILPAENILKNALTHWAFFAERRDKTEELRKFLNAEKPTKALVFTSEVSKVKDMVEKLQRKNINCGGLYSSMEKTERKKTLDSFRSGKVPILITSDITARGLDIQGITHVIQLDLPGDKDFFIHRAGRTGRAGNKGINIVFGDEFELRKLSGLEKTLGITVYPKILRSGKIYAPESIQDTD